MAQTLLLDTETWDLVLDIAGNIAVASDPYSLAQDAASAIQTFLKEVYYDTTYGVDYLGLILGKNPALQLLKQILVLQALTVTDVASAKVFIDNFSDRSISGQAQVTSASTGQVSVAAFSVVNPQGV